MARAGQKRRSHPHPPLAVQSYTISQVLLVVTIFTSPRFEHDMWLADLWVVKRLSKRRRAPPPATTVAVQGWVATATEREHAAAAQIQARARGRLVRAGFYAAQKAQMSHVRGAAKRASWMSKKHVAAKFTKELFHERQTEDGGAAARAPPALLLQQRQLCAQAIAHPQRTGAAQTTMRARLTRARWTPLL